MNSGLPKPHFDATRYASPIRGLLDPLPLSELGFPHPGNATTAHPTTRQILSHLTVEQLAGGRAIKDPTSLKCCLAALWLLHDFPDESHRISQEIETPEGSYWHGIMHRREGDFGNAKYWFRRVGRHSIWADLMTVIPRHRGDQAAAKELSLAVEMPQRSSSPARRLLNEWLEATAWDPFRFVDLCERATAGNDAELTMILRQLAQREWCMLFDFCYEQGLSNSLRKSPSG